MLPGDGQRCRDASPVDVEWLGRNCRRLSVYTVKIAAGTNHSGFAVRPFSSAKEGVEYINFGAEGLYRLPKWDLSHAQYRPLHVASIGEISTLEANHTRQHGGVYFWLTNCCHHNTERELLRMGYGVKGARSITWFDETKISDHPL